MAVTEIYDTDDLMKKYRALLLRGDTVAIPVLGGSMTPFLGDRRDTVWVKATSGPNKVGDIVFYQRENGRYILHRICGVKDGVYTLAGDAHTAVEPGIRQDQIFAVAVRARRKGKIQQPGCFWWEFFARVWVRIIPLRGLLRKAYCKIFHR